jgi:hypothetical protein
VSYILFVLAAFFVALSLEGCRYEVSGLRATGVVLHKEARPRARDKNHVRYRFQAGGGQAIEGRSDVLPQTFADLREGGPVEIEYIRDSPGTNRVAGERARSSVFGAMAVGAIASGLVLRRRERRKRGG